MLIERHLPLSLQGGMVLSQQADADGDLGFIGTAIGIGVGLIASLLGGGYLWTRHEENKLDAEYYKWLEIYQSPPYDMLPEDAVRAARGELPAGKGFNFGLNASTVILVAGSLFALYVGSQVVVSWLSPDKK